MITNLLRILPFSVILLACGGESENDNHEKTETEEGLTIIDEEHEQGEFVSTFEDCVDQNSVEFFLT